MATFFNESKKLLHETKKFFNKHTTKQNVAIVAGIAACCALAAISMPAFMVAVALTLCFIALKVMQDNENPTLLHTIRNFFN